jgi:4-carboxymuconolactone decarboxylase
VDRGYAEADDFMRMFHDVTDEFCWGTVWARPGLTKKMRAALSLAMTSAQSQAGAVKLHVKTCVRAGWSKREIGEILLHTYVYAGVYASLSGFTAAKDAFAELAAEEAAASARNASYKSAEVAGHSNGWIESPPMRAMLIAIRRPNDREPA